MQPGSLFPSKYKKDNYLQEEQEDESDGMVQLGGTIEQSGKDEERDTQRVNSEEDFAKMPQQVKGGQTGTHADLPVNLMDYGQQNDLEDDDNESMIENNYGDGDDDNPVAEDTEELGANDPRSTVTAINVDVPFEESKQLSISKDCQDLNDD